MFLARKLFLVILFFLPIAAVAQNAGFPLPDVPQTLKGPEARANYLALHYWDKYDFDDYSLIGNKDISEQGFSNFISIMPYVTEKEAAFDNFASSIAANVKMLRYFMALGEKYLAEPMSPLYDESLYILLLEKVNELEGLDEANKEQFAFDLRMAKKNRLHTEAADFSYLTREGKRGRLSRVKSEYTLLFLGDPECEVCSIVKGELLDSPVFNDFVGSGRLKVLFVCVEGKTEAWMNAPAPPDWIDACDDKGVIYEKLLYDIPGLPVLYLLDSDKRVVLKNASAGQIKEYLIQLSMQGG